jgi:hypothetical protein
MARGKADQNSAILEYALSHLERERDEIQAKIDHIRRQLGSRPAGSSAASYATSAAPAMTSEPRAKRVLSEAARKRIAAAQKRRWAEHRKAKASAA